MPVKKGLLSLQTVKRWQLASWMHRSTVCQERVTACWRILAISFGDDSVHLHGLQDIHTIGTTGVICFMQYISVLSIHLQCLQQCHLC